MLGHSQNPQKFVPQKFLAIRYVNRHVIILLYNFSGLMIYETRGDQPLQSSFYYSQECGTDSGTALAGPSVHRTQVGQPVELAINIVAE